MATLYRYFKDLRKLAVVALVLAAINQIFSLLDPLIFRHIIDSYATRYREYSSPQFIRGVGLLLAAAVGVALVSRIAKNFQDYFVNVITQKVGARIYTDGVRHSLDLPYTLFEDQRSGETLGKLQRVRSDVEKFIALLVNMVFTTLVGLAFVTIYAAKVHWSIAPAYFLTVPLLGSLSSLLIPRVKTVQQRLGTQPPPLPGSTPHPSPNIPLPHRLPPPHCRPHRIRRGLPPIAVRLSPRLERNRGPRGARRDHRVCRVVGCGQDVFGEIAGRSLPPKEWAYLL